MPEGTAPDRDPGVFRHARDARSGPTATLVALWIGALLLLRVLVAASPWVLALLALPVLPALWELWRNPTAWLELDANRLRWQAPRSQGDIALAEIDHVVLLTRWDFSIRATVHSRLGTHHRLPPEVTPRAQALEKALTERGLRVVRQHFTVF